MDINRIFHVNTPRKHPTSLSCTRAVRKVRFPFLFHNDKHVYLYQITHFWKAQTFTYFLAQSPLQSMHFCIRMTIFCMPEQQISPADSYNPSGLPQHSFNTAQHSSNTAPEPSNTAPTLLQHYPNISSTLLQHFSNTVPMLPQNHPNTPPTVPTLLLGDITAHRPLSFSLSFFFFFPSIMKCQGSVGGMLGQCWRVVGQCWRRVGHC